MPVYIAQFVIVEENLWLTRTEPFEVLRHSARHRIATQLFSASGADEAYARATTMIGGLADSHNDGPGDRTNFRCSGLLDLEEVPLSGRSLAEALDEPFGLDVGLVDLGEVAPEVRSRSQLSLFA